MKREPVRTSILRTLIYAQVFGTGVKEQQLPSLLLSPRRFSRSELHTATQGMIHSKLIFNQNGWLFLPGMVKTAVEDRFNESQWKKKFTHRVIFPLTWFPTILGIAVTGSVAVGNAEAKEDIDLMVITRSGFLWSTRALLTGILMARGLLRRRHNGEVSNKFCLNLWLDQNTLKLNAHTLYVARELVQADWIFERGYVRSHFFKSNAWASKFIVWPPMRGRSISSQGFWPFLAVLFFPVERVCYLLQLAHMGKRTREVITSNKAFFHPRDTQGEVLKKYQALCRRHGIDSLIDN